MVVSAANEYRSLVEKTGRLLQTQRIALRLRPLRSEGLDDMIARTGRTILAFGPVTRLISTSEGKVTGSRLSASQSRILTRQPRRPGPSIFPVRPKRPRSKMQPSGRSFAAWPGMGYVKALPTVDEATRRQI
jgi:hypothetical protein